MKKIVSKNESLIHTNKSDASDKGTKDDLSKDTKDNVSEDQNDLSLKEKKSSKDVKNNNIAPSKSMLVELIDSRLGQVQKSDLKIV